LFSTAIVCSSVVPNLAVIPSFIKNSQALRVSDDDCCTRVVIKVDAVFLLTLIQKKLINKIVDQYFANK